VPNPDQSVAPEERANITTSRPMVSDLEVVIPQPDPHFIYVS